MTRKNQVSLSLELGLLHLTASAKKFLGITPDRPKAALGQLLYSTPIYSRVESREK